MSWENIKSFGLDSWKKRNWWIPPSVDKESKFGSLLFRKFRNFWNKYALIVIIIGGFYWLFFAWSVKFIDIAIASIMVELGVVLFVILRYLDKKSSNKGKQEEGLSKPIWFLFIFALLGVIYITLSHTTIGQTFSYTGLLLLTVILLIVGARVERSLKWAEQVSQKWREYIDEGYREGRLTKPDTNQKSQASKKKNAEDNAEKWEEKIFLLLGLSIGSFLTFTLLILGTIFWIFQGNTWNLSFSPISIELFANEIIISTTVSWVICIVGGFASAIGVWSFRESNRITDTLDINGIYYLTPILSLVWLFPFGLAQIQRWDYFIVGALIIMATSILIAIETDTGRLGFRWLIVSLWSTGLLIYFREQWIRWPWLADDTPWEWKLEAVDYYSLIVLSATIFILILSFRTSRLVERINREENQFLRMKNILKYLNYLSPLNGDTDKKLNEYLDQIDQFDTKSTKGSVIQKRDSDILKNFVKNIDSIRDANKPSDKPDINKPSDLETEYIKQLSDLELEFELLYRSKQRGRYFAENLVLYIFALVTIMVTIGTRPFATSYWNALMIDVLAFLFSAAICFMTVNLTDLRAYREKSTAELMKIEEKGERDKDAINQKAVQVISIILAVVISISFVVLLYDKWMGIWFL